MGLNAKSVEGIKLDSDELVLKSPGRWIERSPGNAPLTYRRVSRKPLRRRDRAEGEGSCGSTKLRFVRIASTYLWENEKAGMRIKQRDSFDRRQRTTFSA